MMQPASVVAEPPQSGERRFQSLSKVPRLAPEVSNEVVKVMATSIWRMRRFSGAAPEAGLSGPRGPRPPRISA